MTGLFSRILRMGKAEVHSAVDKLEDPIKMTEQGIRDLKKDLQGSMKSLAEVKGITIRMKKEAEDNKRMAADYERKAMLLLQKMQKGEMDNADAERLATEAICSNTLLPFGWRWIEYIFTRKLPTTYELDP